MNKREVMTSKRTKTTWLTAALVVLVVSAAALIIPKVFTAMDENPETGTLLQSVDAHEAAFAVNIAEVQELISGADEAFGGWEQPSPATLEQCGDRSTGEHAFAAFFSVGNTGGWHFPNGEAAFRDAIGVRLSDAGWQNITGAEFKGDIDSVSLRAELPGEVESLLIMFYPGEVADGITVNMQSACQPGSVADIWSASRDARTNS